MRRSTRRKRRSLGFAGQSAADAGVAARDSAGGRPGAPRATGGRSSVPPALLLAEPPDRQGVEPAAASRARGPRRDLLPGDAHQQLARQPCPRGGARAFTGFGEAGERQGVRHVRPALAEELGHLAMAVAVALDQRRERLGLLERRRGPRAGGSRSARSRADRRRRGRAPAGDRGPRAAPPGSAARRRAARSRPPRRRTTIGCSRPCARIDAASSASFSSSKCFRG